MTASDEQTETKNLMGTTKFKSPSNVPYALDLYVPNDGCGHGANTDVLGKQLEPQRLNFNPSTPHSHHTLNEITPRTSCRSATICSLCTDRRLFISSSRRYGPRVGAAGSHPDRSTARFSWSGCTLDA